MAINGVGFFSYNKGAIKYSIDDTNLPIINIEITSPKSFNSNFDISLRGTKNRILEIFEKQTEIAEFDEDLKKDFFKGFNKILNSYSSEYKNNKSKYKKAKSEIVKIQPVMNLPKKTTSLKAKPSKSRRIKTLIKAKNKVYKQNKFKAPNYSKFQDELRTAMPPGYRVSKQGNVYFENRINRSDKEGSLTGLSGTEYFDLTNIENLDDLKKAYYKLVQKLHPDKQTGDEEEFKNMLNEYQTLTDSYLQNNKFKRAEVKNEIEIDEEVKKLIVDLLPYENIKIELIGTWIWVSGLKIEFTDELRDILKKIGFKYSWKKTMWYFDTTGSKYFKNKGQVPIDDIRKKYGSKGFKGGRGKINGLNNDLFKQLNKIIWLVKKRKLYLKKI